MKGIPEFMHRHQDDIYEGVHYVCGVKYQSWSEKWMNSHSDICERDGENVYRFTAGTDIAYLPLCPQCWQDESFKISSPKPTAFNELNFKGLHGYEVAKNQPSIEVESETALYLWDFITL